MGNAEGSTEGVAAADLQYAPTPRAAGWGRPWAVLGGGAVSAAVAVVGVYLLMRYEREDPFTWHVLDVVPVGSVLVAAVAAVGFPVAARLAHVRAGWRLAAAAAVLMVGVYVAALYAEFSPFPWVDRRTGLPLSFAGFVNLQSVSWTWRSHGGRVQLGRWGYAFRAVDVAVFAAAGAFAARLPRAAAYCDLCQLFPTRRRLAVFPASSAYRSTSGLPADERAAFQAEQEEQLAAALEGGRLLLTLAAAGDVEAVREAAASVRADRRAIAALPTRLALDLETCPGCRATTLRTVLLVGRVARPVDGRDVSGAFADLLRRGGVGGG